MAYTPKNWVCGEIITADGLNNLENGVSEALECCSGGGGGGYECTEIRTTIIDESVTTQHTNWGNNAQLSDAPSADNIEVEFNGTKYNCTKIMDGDSYWYYGTPYWEGDWSVYPFEIGSDGNLYTETPGTYTVKVTEIAESIEVSECFDKAVRSISGITECKMGLVELTQDGEMSAEGSTLLVLSNYGIDLDSHPTLVVNIDGDDIECAWNADNSAWQDADQTMELRWEDYDEDGVNDHLTISFFNREDPAWGHVSAMTYTPETTPCFEGAVGNSYAVKKIIERTKNVVTHLVDGEAEGSFRTTSAYSEGSEYRLGQHASALGTATRASAYASYAEGVNTEANQRAAHAEGENTVANGVGSHAEGGANVSGTYTTASGIYSHAEGEHTTASGNAAHAEGGATTASGMQSHAEGGNTTASGRYSHAEGFNTAATHMSQHVFGENNVFDPSSAGGSSRGTYIEIVGNGSTGQHRSNARTLDWAGNEALKGSLTLGAGTPNEITVTATQLQALLALLQQ